jgi:hypothetical protein
MRVKGVTDADFSFEDSDGYVVFDSTTTSLETITSELERLTGFSAERR